MKIQRRGHGVPNAEVHGVKQLPENSLPLADVKSSEMLKRAHRHTENWMSGLVAVK
jgi:hypothetical protein